ncbi:MAG: YesL family protein [Clostridia bacterium]
MFQRKVKHDTSPETRQTGFDSSFWKPFSMLGDFFILTCFWVFTSIPIVTIGTSTTALFYVVLKTRNGEAGALWKMYKKSFLANLKQSVGIWLLYLFIMIDVCIIGYLLQANGMLTLADLQRGGQYHVILIVAALVYMSMMIYTAALLAFFKQTTCQCLLSSFCLIFNRLFSTLYFMIVIGALGIITWYFFPPLVFIDVPLAVYLISLRMYKIFQKQIDRVQAHQKAQAEPSDASSGQTTA